MRNTKKRYCSVKNIFWLVIYFRLYWVSVLNGEHLRIHLKSIELWESSILVHTWPIYRFSCFSYHSLLEKYMLKLKIWLFHPYVQARGSILVASSPEILTRVKKVAIILIQGIAAQLVSIVLVLLSHIWFGNFISLPIVFSTK